LSLKHASRRADEHEVARRPGTKVPGPIGARPTGGRPPRRSLWSSLAWGGAATLVAFALLLLDVRASGDGILAPIRAGSRGPAASVVAHDFPTVAAPDETGFDGQQFYAIARDPFHPDTVAHGLDSPRYRYQRPLYPMLAWLLHPSGGGPGLVWALIAISLLGVFVGALAIGAVSDTLGGPPWLPLIYPVLPGALWAVTSSEADTLAVSLSLVAVAATLRRRPGLAWLAAVAAVLTKETAILVPVALLLSRRRRADLPLVVLPALALGAWLLVVHLWVPGGGLSPERLGLPLTGVIAAARTRWLHGTELTGMASVVSGCVVGAFALARRRGPSELRWVVGGQLALVAVCSRAVLGDDFGGTRVSLMLTATAVALLLTGSRGGKATVALDEERPEAHLPGLGATVA
jgi:hypothetical protein